MMTRRLDDLLVCARALHYAKMLTGPLTQAAGPFSPPKPHMQIFCSHEQHMPRSRSHPKYPTPGQSPERAPERLQPHMRAPRYTIRVAAAVLRQQHKSQNENRGLDFYKKICYNIKKRLAAGAANQTPTGPAAIFRKLSSGISHTRPTKTPLGLQSSFREFFSAVQFCTARRAAN